MLPTEVRIRGDKSVGIKIDEKRRLISTHLPIQASQVFVCVWLCDLPAALSVRLGLCKRMPRRRERPANRTDNRFAGALPTLSWALSEI